MIGESLARLAERFAGHVRAGVRCLRLPARIQAIQPGSTAAAQVRESLGPPASEWTNANGTTTMEYPGMPFGEANYMIDVAPDGLVRQVRQVLNEQNFARICAGMDQEDVRRTLGTPAHIFRPPFGGQEIWDWKIAQNSASTLFFNVHFDRNGQVAGTSRNTEHQG